VHERAAGPDIGYNKVVLILFIYLMVLSYLQNTIQHIIKTRL